LNPRPLRAVLLVAVATAGLRLPAADGAAPVDFNRQVRPLLSDNCFRCHGPDESSREARLRLDVRDAALRPAKSGAIPIVPGDPQRSELILRITDEHDAMPPA
jgi:mono/diheme cytochrome c family protein